MDTNIWPHGHSGIALIGRAPCRLIIFSWKRRQGSKLLEISAQPCLRKLIFIRMIGIVSVYIFTFNFLVVFFFSVRLIGYGLSNVSDKLIDEYSMISHCQGNAKIGV